VFSRRARCSRSRRHRSRRPERPQRPDQGLDPILADVVRGVAFLKCRDVKTLLPGCRPSEYVPQGECGDHSDTPGRTYSNRSHRDP